VCVYDPVNVTHAAVANFDVAIKYIHADFIKNKIYGPQYRYPLPLFPSLNEHGPRSRAKYTQAR
jgi:hypothetical protein